MVVTDRLVLVFGWFGTVRETGNSPTFIQNLSLSLVFSFFSLFAGMLIGVGSRGLKAGRGVAVISCGVHETWRSLENSRVFWQLSFFFVFFFFPVSLQSHKTI